MIKEREEKGGGGAKRLYSISELPRVFGMSRWWWYSRVWNGQLPTIRLGGRYAIDARDIEKMLAENRRVAVN